LCKASFELELEFDAGSVAMRRLMNVFVALGCFWLTAALSTAPLSAEEAPPKKRVALVIGNDAYLGGGEKDDAKSKHLGKLANPVRDARAVAALLKRHGFAVTEDYDLDYSGFRRVLRRFSNEATGADTALVFYAGHGMEVVEKDDVLNVLAPIDAEIDCETRDHFNTVALTEITKAIRGVKNQIVILDACRDNPFPNCPVRSAGTRGYGFRAADLAKARRGEAILLAYSTAQKSVARDGAPGDHSPFARELLAVLGDSPHAHFWPLMNQLVVKVGVATKFSQVPSVTIEGGLPLTCLAGTGCSDDVDVEAQRRRVRLLASVARGQPPVESMLLALEALPDQKAGIRLPYEAAAEQILFEGFIRSRKQRGVILRIPEAEGAPSVSGGAFSADGKRIVFSATKSDGTAHTASLWDAEGREVAVLKGHTAPVLRALFSPDGKRIVTASKDGTARLWNAKGEEIAVLNGHADIVWSATFSADSKLIVTTSKDGTARLWNADGLGIATLKGHTALVGAAVFSPDRRRIATASDDTTARLWGIRGDEVATLKGHTDQVWDVAFNADGSRIVTASKDGSARLWDVEGREISILKGHRGPVQRAIFSPDAKRIVTTSDDGTARLWDLEGHEIAVLVGRPVTVPAFSVDKQRPVQDRVWGVAYLPDSTRFITISLAAVRLWDGNGAELAVFEHVGNLVSGAALSPDGKRIVIANRSGEADVWPLFATTQELIDHVKAVVPRCLTKEQRKQYGLAADPPEWCATKWPYAGTTKSTPAPADEPTASEWMDQWLKVRAPLGALRIARFKDPTYVLTKEIGWKPNSAEQAAKLKAVQVPQGFVTDFASIPRLFWSSLRPDGDYAYAAVIHDYLYWSQETDRETADEIFRQAMIDFKIPSVTAWAIHKAVRLGGEKYWRQVPELKAKGEKRILKTLPDDPLITWDQWRTRPDVFK
jgi:WD40 repeat protein